MILMSVLFALLMIFERNHSNSDVTSIHNINDASPLILGSRYFLEGTWEDPAKIEFEDESQGFQVKLLPGTDQFLHGRFEFDGFNYKPKLEWEKLIQNKAGAVHLCKIHIRYRPGKSKWEVSFVHPRGTHRYEHPPMCLKGKDPARRVTEPKLDLHYDYWNPIQSVQELKIQFTNSGQKGYSINRPEDDVMIIELHNAMVEFIGEVNVELETFTLGNKFEL